MIRYEGKEVLAFLEALKAREDYETLKIKV